MTYHIYNIYNIYIIYIIIYIYTNVRPPRVSASPRFLRSFTTVHGRSRARQAVPLFRRTLEILQANVVPRERNEDSGALVKGYSTGKPQAKQMFVGRW